MARLLATAVPSKSAERSVVTSAVTDADRSMRAKTLPVLIGRSDQYSSLYVKRLSAALKKRIAAAASSISACLAAGYINFLRALICQTMEQR